MASNNVSNSSELSQSFSESHHFAYQKTSAGTSDFNHPCQGYANYRYISTDLSNQMTRTQNDGQNSDSSQWIQILNQAPGIAPTSIWVLSILHDKKTVIVNILLHEYYPHLYGGEFFRYFDSLKQTFWREREKLFLKVFFVVFLGDGNLPIVRNF